MLEHQPELMNLEVTDVEFRQILHEIGEMEYGGPESVRVADIVEATQCDPMAVAAILSRLRGQYIVAKHSEDITDHELRLRDLEQWKKSKESEQGSPSVRIDRSMLGDGIASKITESTIASNSRRTESVMADDNLVFDFITGKWHSCSREYEVDEPRDLFAGYYKWSIAHVFLILVVLTGICYAFLSVVR